jgi:predicted nuclease of predicted toxin-antitoxin system
MNFLADESVDYQIVDRLRQEGHLVRYIAEMEAGISDDVVLNLANKEASLLLTADKDFGRPGGSHQMSINSLTNV